MGGATEGVGLERGAEVRLVVLLVIPALHSTNIGELASRADTLGLTEKG